MPDYTITIADIGGATGAADWIAFVAGADACMAANDVPEATGRLLKVEAVRHALAVASGTAAVTSERAVSGAARTFAARAKQTGLDATAHGALLRSMDKWGCVLRLFSQSAGVSIRSVG